MYTSILLFTLVLLLVFFFFFFNDTATTEIYTLSLHDALPICADVLAALELHIGPAMHGQHGAAAPAPAVSTVAGADFPGLGGDKADSAAKTVTGHCAWTFPWVASSFDYS